jgi:ribosome-associated protein
VNKTRRGSLNKRRTKSSSKPAGAGHETAAGRIPVRGARTHAKPGVKVGGKVGGKAHGGGRAARSGRTLDAKGAGKRRAAKLRSRPALEMTPRAARGAADLAETRALAIDAMGAALEKHALQPVLIDVSGMGSYTDFIGIVSGRSDRQVDAIAENVVHTLKARGKMVLGQEGSGSGRWTLLDFGAFVMHVFYHPVREFYDLESLWIEAPRVKLDVPSQAVLGQADALYGAL